MEDTENLAGYLLHSSAFWHLPFGFSPVTSGTHMTPPARANLTCHPAECMNKTHMGTLSI
jgi:hypothetical protein